ncbi:MAG: 3-hydroxyacyl-[acyl-carrier-protein] dehydratase [Thermoanaerobaculia bacterium]|jgi:3-hydroxyacyl-[acyl-carrier-protein] dehydratase|nr:3-hydroxyacyl-[acyl-carrier-protein] dehydratase [Thermoanaerobaculia bacterium]
MLTITEIMKLLPHRYPMLLVDRVIEIDDDGKRIVGLKNVSANEQFFQGHFPGNPVMPGVLIVEAMAQCAAILGLREMPDREKKLFLFGGVDKARFRRPVVPGDQLKLECTVLQRRSTSVKISGKATVDGQLVAEAELFSVLIDRPE